MKLDLEAIEARCEVATKEPWTHTDGLLSYDFATIVDTDVMLVTHVNNIDFIVHARADIPALLAEVERLRAELASEHRLTIMYSDRDAAVRRKLQEVGAIASHEEITNLDAIERQQVEVKRLQDEVEKWLRLKPE